MRLYDNVVMALADRRGSARVQKKYGTPFVVGYG